MGSTASCSPTSASRQEASTRTGELTARAGPPGRARGAGLAKTYGYTGDFPLCLDVELADLQPLPVEDGRVHPGLVRRGPRSGRSPRGLREPSTASGHGEGQGASGVRVDCELGQHDRKPPRPARRQGDSREPLGSAPASARGSTPGSSGREAVQHPRLQRGHQRGRPRLPRAPAGREEGAGPQARASASPRRSRTAGRARHPSHVHSAVAQDRTALSRRTEKPVRRRDRDRAEGLPIRPRPRGKRKVRPRERARPAQGGQEGEGLPRRGEA